MIVTVDSMQINKSRFLTQAFFWHDLIHTFEFSLPWPLRSIVEIMVNFNFNQAYPVVADASIRILYIMETLKHVSKLKNWSSLMQEP